jgi:hypothetical protein
LCKASTVRAGQREAHPNIPPFTLPATYHSCERPVQHASPVVLVHARVVGRGRTQSKTTFPLLCVAREIFVELNANLWAFFELQVQPLLQVCRRSNRQQTCNLANMGHPIAILQWYDGLTASKLVQGVASWCETSIWEPNEAWYVHCASRTLHVEGVRDGWMHVIP